MNLKRLPITLKPDPLRVLIRSFWPDPDPRVHPSAGVPRHFISFAGSFLDGVPRKRLVEPVIRF